jgi:hypothetical protein
MVGLVRKMHKPSDCDGHDNERREYACGRNRDFRE